jgi:hypothetical protein
MDDRSAALTLALGLGAAFALRRGAAVRPWLAQRVP